MSTLTVGIAGITGKVGQLLASKLLAKPNTIIRGYARDPSKVAAEIASSSRVHLFKGEASDSASLASFVTGCDVVVCSYLGPPNLMVDGQKVLIDACDEAGVARYVASDWSLDYTKLELGQLFPKDPMIIIKAYLETKKYVKGVHVMIGGFMDTILSPFFGLFDGESKTFRYWGEGTEFWEGTSYANAAEFTAAVITDPWAMGVLKYLGDRKTVPQIAEAFQEVYGIETKLERLGSLDDLKKHMHATQAANPANLYSYLALFYAYYSFNGQTFLGETLNDKYPEVKPETLADFLRTHTVEDLSRYGT
ncbi:hypothetical protein B0T10DRAFT_575796 [Thelonectria olida]|uniref:NAD(P)-binding domain-containing protein n=1 Tax=Thelonectria olida TaxID=1576542 RepID=A0A9P9AJR8_9HYPO|nr:hypothetical protein B0T10DRAFT_575796 [Thelonectria olida]